MPKRQIQPEQIRETYKRHRLPLPWSAQLDNCKRLCAGWHNRFAACRVLDDDRLRALCRRLVDDGWSYSECAWAIEAYYDHCITDAWRIANPQARKTLAAFFKDERFEDWIEKGQQLASKRAGRHRQAARRGGNELLDAWHARPPDEQQSLIDRAVEELGMQRKSPEARTFEHPLIRSKVLQYVQQELADANRLGATPAGAMV